MGLASQSFSLVFPAARDAAYRIFRQRGGIDYGAFRIPPFATTRIMAWLQETFGITYAQLNDFFDTFHYGIVGPYVFWVLILGHAGAALYHHVVQKDDVLTRMLPNK
jgi:cytochrome b561